MKTARYTFTAGDLPLDTRIEFAVGGTIFDIFHRKIAGKWSLVAEKRGTKSEAEIETSIANPLPRLKIDWSTDLARAIVFARDTTGYDQDVFGMDFGYARPVEVWSAWFEMLRNEGAELVKIEPDSDSYRLEVRLQRSMTPEDQEREEARRAEVEHARTLQREASEREQYERLKAKFEAEEK